LCPEKASCGPYLRSRVSEILDAALLRLRFRKALRPWSETQPALSERKPDQWMGDLPLKRYFQIPLD
jgi:hypothetical protein